MLNGIDVKSTVLIFLKSCLARVRWIDSEQEDSARPISFKLVDALKAHNRSWIKTNECRSEVKQLLFRGLKPAEQHRLVSQNKLAKNKGRLAKLLPRKLERDQDDDKKGKYSRKS